MSRTPRYCLLIFLLGMVCPSKSAWAQLDSEKALADIRNAFESLEFAVAEARISDALKDFDQFMPAQLSQIHVVYALILFARNDQGGAESQLAQAIQLTPALNLDPLDTPPQLFEAFTRIKQTYETKTQDPEAQAEIRYLLVNDPRAGAAIRSMAVPGWGQFYKGERKKGYVLSGLWTLTAGGTLLSHLKRKQSKDHYLASETQEQTLERFGDFRTWHKVRNNLFLGAVGVWAYSYLDAVLRRNAIPGQQALSVPVKLSVDPSPHQMRISLKWQF